MPTSSTVIDGSRESPTWYTHSHLAPVKERKPNPCLPFTESTDDDKVVAWHWEEVKGPLREEKVSADTPVLTLTSLVPGNYTFR